MVNKNTDLKSALEQLEVTLEKYLVDKVPFSIPNDWKELIVKFAPYLMILAVAGMLLNLLAAFGVTSVMAPVGYFGGFRWGFWYFLMVVHMFLTLVLEVLAIKPLFARHVKGWRYIYYVTILSATYSLITFSLGGLIGVAISLYILFQIKRYYN